MLSVSGVFALRLRAEPLYPDRRRARPPVARRDALGGAPRQALRGRIEDYLVAGRGMGLHRHRLARLDQDRIITYAYQAQFGFSPAFSAFRRRSDHDRRRLLRRSDGLRDQRLREARVMTVPEYFERRVRPWRACSPAS